MIIIMDIYHALISALSAQSVSGSVRSFVLLLLSESVQGFG